MLIIRLGWCVVKILFSGEVGTIPIGSGDRLAELEGKQTLYDAGLLFRGV
jgi:hypothetical protein